MTTQTSPLQIRALIVHVASINDGRELLNLNPIENKVYDCLSKNFWPGT